MTRQVVIYGYLLKLKENLFLEIKNFELEGQFIKTTVINI